MSLLSVIREVLVFISGGRECVRCGARCGALSLCKECASYVAQDMTVVEGKKRCCVCGKVLISEKDICMRCRDESKRVLRHTSRVLPIASYRLWNREMLVLWKGEGNRSFTPFFAKRMADAIHMLGDTVIVSVPPRYGKLHTRGWDQIDDLCKYLRRDFTVLNILRRTNNVEQKSLSGAERLAMIESGIYAVKAPRALRRELRKTGDEVPRRVCLIDDVMTTGATIESCAIALLNAGVKEVDAVTLFCVD